MRFFTEYRQKDWLEKLATVELAVNNKFHSATKLSPFMANYGRELRMGVDIMTGDFNIYNSLWDPLFSYHSSISDDLLIIADLFNLKLSNPTNQVPTRLGERWYSRRAPCPCILCLSQTYLRLWIQFLSSPLCLVTA